MKILMVCLGNICRSPLAEGIMQDKIRQRNLHGWEVDSAGTGNWHAGEQPDPRSIRTAQKHGIDITAQRARQFSRRDFKRFDLILAMDQSNLHNLRQLADTEADRLRLRLILEAAYPGNIREVPDPYWDDNGFEAVFQMLDDACERILDAIVAPAALQVYSSPN
jgi:protein-tyrosine phosphatase